MNIVFENDGVMVVDKPAGLVTNRSETVKEETLQDQLSLYFGLKSGDLGVGDRVGIVHRLDRETSGLLIVAKTQKTYEHLQSQFKNREVKKAYVALVHGFIKDDEGSVDVAITRIGKYGKFGVVKYRREDSGKEASTDYKKIEKFRLKSLNFEKLIDGSGFNRNRARYLTAQAMDYSLAEFYPKTGRTHQIRVHAKHIGHPIVSDKIYAPSKLLKFDLLWCSRLFLHAKKIVFLNPGTKKVLSFESELPEDLKSALALLAQE